MAQLEDGGPMFPRNHFLRSASDGVGGKTTLAEEFSEGSTLRDYACIHLRIPETGKPWLDKLIAKARRDELAGRAMQGLMAADSEWQYSPSKIAVEAWFQADAVLAAGQKATKE